MLDVGFHPMVWYPLQTMEKGGVRQVFLVAAGDASAATFSAWASEPEGRVRDRRRRRPGGRRHRRRPSRRRPATPRTHRRRRRRRSRHRRSPRRLLQRTHAPRRGGHRALVDAAWNPVDVKTGRPPGAHYIGLSDENHLLFMGDEEDVDKVAENRRAVRPRPR